MKEAPLNLRREVEDTIERMLAAGEPVIKAWVQHAIVRGHQRPTGDDAWYWIANEATALSELISEAIRHRKDIDPVDPNDPAGPKKPKTLPLEPGWMHLQTHYSINREEERCFIPREQLSREEAEQKLLEFKRNISGLQGHMREFRQWMERKFEKVG